MQLFLGVTLDALVRWCAPQVAPRTALAVIAVESGGDPWAVNDNRARRAYHFPTRRAAEAFARSRLGTGGNLDLGLTQLNSANLAPLGVQLGEAFDPCVNVWAGMVVLTADYRRAVAAYAAPAQALFHAFEAYNAGTFLGAPRYAQTVWQTALSLQSSLGSETSGGR